MNWAAAAVVSTFVLGTPAAVGATLELVTPEDPVPAVVIVVLATEPPGGGAQLTPQTSAPVSCAHTVPGEGGPTEPVQPPSAPEGPDQQENPMSIYQGQHVTAEFPDATVDAVVLEVCSDQALVQEHGTQRAEWIPLDDLN